MNLSFAALVEENRTVLTRLALRLCGRVESDAEDLLQDALERALRSFHVYRPGSPFVSWIATIVHNRHIDRCRRVRRRPIHLELVDDRVAAPEGDEPRVLESERYSVDDVRRALDEIDGPFREAFVLREVDGRTYEEIARLQEVPRATVGSRLVRARRQIREVLLRRGPRAA